VRAVVAVGCVLDAESDAMLSSGSALMSSAGGSDDVMDESWLQRQQQLDVDTDTSPALNSCPLDDGKSSETGTGRDDDASKANGNTDSAAACDPATESRTPVTESDKSDSGLYSQETSVNYAPREPTAENNVRTSNETNKQIQISEQNQQELVSNENDQSTVEEPVSTSESAAESQLPTDDATEADAAAVSPRQAPDEIQKVSTSGLDETRTLTAAVDSCQSSSQPAGPATQTLIESSDDRSEISSETVEDVKPAASTCIDSVANSDVTTKTQMKDRKIIEEQATVSKQQVRSNSNKTSSKKESGLSTTKRTSLAAATDKLDKTAGSRSSTNPRSTRVAVSTTSKERRSRDSVDTVQPGDTSTAEKSKPKREKDKAQPDVDSKPSLKSPASTQKASDRTARTSSAAVVRRDAAEKSSSQITKQKKDAAANAATKETEKTTRGTENKTSLSTSATDTKRIPGKRHEQQNAEDPEKNGDDKRKETTSKPTDTSPANSSQESTNPTRLLGSVRNAGKSTSLSAKKSSAARSNPKPDDADKDSETQRGETGKANEKRRTKSTGLNPTVGGSVSDGTAGADRPAEKLPKDPSSTTGNPGNPRSAADRSTTPGTSKDSSSLPTRRQQPQRSTGTRGAAEKPTTSVLPGRVAGQTAKTTQQRVDKPSDMAAGDSKAPRSSGKQHAVRLHVS